ncbi:diguanylate cyclase [Shewanella colwelliana]|nr:sensor domain-containing diguanylate cyclase [Shewanella colwelliana]OEG73001.1 diguanylate cyclase [Shewanella colwelliana]
MGSIDNVAAGVSYAKYKRGVIYSGLLVLFLLMVIGITYVVSMQSISHERENMQYTELAIIENSLVSELSIVGADLTYYAHSNIAASALAGSERAKDYLTSLMFQISLLYKHYDQIRLFDAKGDEVIRIAQNRDGMLQLAPADQLQNKYDRYYFQDLLRLTPKQTYTSAFDLNVEHGEVEQPFKPTIRFATPIHSAQGEFIGAGVINYNGQDLLDIIDSLNVHDNDKAYLINRDGYYLKGDRPEDEWRFMFPDKAQVRFAEDYPIVWRRMQQADRGKVETDRGEFYFSLFQLSPNSTFKTANGESAYLVMFVPDTTIREGYKTLNSGVVLAFLLLVPMFIFLAYKLASSQVEQDRLFKQLHFDARHDALTGLYNRQAIVDYLGKNISSCRRRKAKLAVSFIDVNLLKKTNDQYGHDAGDELIKGVATVINMSIRECDFAARIGGDEFLIVFVDCDVANANRVMERIQAAYTVLGLSQTGHQWSMSYGCTQLHNKTDDVDSIIERADKLMYEHKVAQRSEAL